MFNKLEKEYLIKLLTEKNNIEYNQVKTCAEFAIKHNEKYWNRMKNGSLKRIGLISKIIVKLQQNGKQ